MPPADFFQIKNFIHRSAPYEPAFCDSTDPCDGLYECETFINSCAVAPWRGTRLAESNAHDQFKISAEVFCTDRVASNWENVLHVHTGTNREKFGDRYFTIWKQGGHADEIRIVAPAFDNPHYELNAYVDCAPGWHTFTVQQSKFDGNKMNLETIFDEDVVESQVVEKNNLFSGPLFVDVSNEFAWPAAYDHLVRNFYHQNIACTDPCVGKENCQTIVNECEILPVTNTKIMELEASLNFKASVEVLCDHSLPLDGQWKNIFHMTGGENYGAPGDRTFAMFRSRNDNQLLITVNDPAGSNHQKYVYDECSPGRWNEYSVEVRQVENNPSLVRYVLSVNEREVLEGFYSRDETLSEGPIHVFSADDYYQTATAHAIRNFYYQTFDELEGISCDDPTDPCVGLDNCSTIVDSCPVAPEPNKQIGTVDASLNYKLSVDVLCSHMMPFDGQWKNIFHVTGGDNYGQPGDRTFAMFRNRNENKLLIVANDPNGSNHQSIRYVDCNDDEWNTYSLEVRQDETSINILKYAIFIDGVEIDAGLYSRDGALTEGDLKVFVSDDYYDSALTFPVRNFFYQTFEEIEEVACDNSTDPCDGLENCTTVVDSCPINPKKNVEVGTVSASLNYKFSADVLCSHIMPLDGQWKNIVHVTGGGNYGNPGDRTFGMFRNRNENKILIVANDPAGSNHQSIRYVDCNDGEWNKYSVEVRQDETSINILKYTISIDNVQIDEGIYSRDGALAEGDLKVFVSDDYYDSGIAFAVRNVFFQTFDEIEEISCSSPIDPCDGLENCSTVIDSCPVSPKKNTQVGTVSAAINYKVSVDLLCSHLQPLDGQWKNIFHVTGGDNYGEPGDRTFAMFRKRNENKLLIVANDPNGSNHQSVKYVDCNDGDWNTYSLEVRQDGDSPSTLLYEITIDGVKVDEGSYGIEGALTEGDLQVFVSDDFYDSGIAFSVRNLFFQTFE